MRIAAWAGLPDLWHQYVPARQDAQDAGQEVDATTPCCGSDTVGIVLGVVDTSVSRVGMDSWGDDVLTELKRSQGVLRQAGSFHFYERHPLTAATVGNLELAYLLISRTGWFREEKIS